MGDATFGAIIGAASAAAQAGAAAKANSKQRKFIKAQRETAFQTQRTDLELAGYNPLYGFASSNLGARMGGTQNFNPGQGIGGAVNSGFQAYRARQQQKNLRSQHDLMRNQAGQANASANLLANQTATEDTKQALNKANEKLLGVNTKLLELEIPGASTAASIERGWFGKGTRHIKRAIDAFNPLTPRQTIHHRGRR